MSLVNPTVSTAAGVDSATATSSGSATTPSQLLPAAPAAPSRRVASVGFAAPKSVALFHYEEPDLADGQFDVDTLYSGISAGTELTQYRGTNPYLHGRWDESLKLFVPAAEAAEAASRASQEYPVRFTGYMEVGRVVASRAPNVRFGEAFHHNGLRHLCAQIRRVPRRLAGTWDRRRLAEETIAFLRDCGPAVREHLITDVVPFVEAQRAYDALDAGAPNVIQAVLDPTSPAAAQLN